MIRVFILWGELRKAQPESGFMEKPGIQPATLGLQDIGLSPTPQQLK